jgi:hypothetical protein
MHPSYVKHDDKRWYVVRQARVDGEPAYVLRAPRGRGRQQAVLARVSECQPWVKPAESLRVFRADGYVLEIRARGAQVREMKVRRAQSSKRWDTSVPAIFRLTVAAHVARNRKPRRRRL